ncbi:MAG: prepilin-type N-terminal cleavage/methylation domain-containing protein [Candidatus Pacebacteria bacterium]|nr:prepilin-type N-terminal cleavage/methylation domain-containing protein [Candidatus Paceibacterota bacterium]
MTINNKNNAGFTLLEVLISVLIIGIISSITMMSNMGESKKQANFANVKTEWILNEGKYISKLLGKWSFDEKSGTNVIDGSTYGRNGVLNGTVDSSTWKQEKDCILGGCLIFDGNTNYVEFKKVDITNKLTVSFWFNISSFTNTWQSLFYSVTGESLYPRGVVNSSTKLPWFQYRLDGITKSIISPDVIEPNTWYYYVGTIDTASGGKLYINGEKKAENADTGTLISGGVTNAYIGRDINLNSWMNGKIDEFSLYDEVMSISEIEDNYMAGLDHLLAKGLIGKEEYMQKVSKFNNINNIANKY